MRRRAVRGRAGPCAAVAALALASSILIAPPTAGALPSQPAPAAPAPDVADPSLSPEVAALPAHSAELDAASSTLDRAIATLERDSLELDQAEAALATSTETARATATLIERHRTLLGKVRRVAALRRDALRALAAEWYAAGTAGQRSFDPTLGADELEDLRRREVLGAAAAAETTGSLRFLDGRSRDLQHDIDGLQRTADQLDGRLAEQSERVERLRSAVETGSAAVSGARARVAAARVSAEIDGTDLPTVSLDAYWRAQQAMGLLQPSCGLSWWVLAGIGRTESRHGTYLGSRPTPGGRVEPPILGPPLDGTNGFRTVTDSDGGALDGEPGFDRAVGPMQFLPSTWRTVGRDADGDGASDPDNIYDAALGAAIYLCRGGPVADEAGMRRGYLAYNRSQAYVDAVTAYAFAYRDAVALPGRSGS